VVRIVGPWLRIVTPRIVTFVHSTGWISYIGELTIVWPETGSLSVAGAQLAVSQPSLGGDAQVHRRNEGKRLSVNSQS
jgi:hypothetical protein